MGTNTVVMCLTRNILYTIGDEFISLMSKIVVYNIVIRIKKMKYFSIIVDSTPDRFLNRLLTLIN
jgi:hypothetical protein